MVSSLLSLSPLSELAGGSVVSPNRHLRVPDDITTHALTNSSSTIYLFIYFNHDTFLKNCRETFVDALSNFLFLALITIWCFSEEET